MPTYVGHDRVLHERRMLSTIQSIPDGSNMTDFCHCRILTSQSLYLVRALHVANAWQAPQATHNPREVPHVFGFQNKFDHRF